MAIRQVLLNGAGTSGDGTTWNDLSDATSAYIGVAGLIAACAASTAGDVVYTKGSDSVATSTHNLAGSGTRANPVLLYGCKSTTTNNQGAIVTSDIIPGYRTGNATPAYADADIPTVAIVSAGGSVSFTGNMKVYGIFVATRNDINVGLTANTRNVFEECHLEVEGASDSISFGPVASGEVYAYDCYLKPQLGNLQCGPGSVFVTGGAIESNNTDGVLETGFVVNNVAHFYAVDFTPGTATNLVWSLSQLAFHIVLTNCQFPATFTLKASTGVTWSVEAYGCSNDTGKATGSSVQAIERNTPEGIVVNETVKVRTGGADDGADGLFSWDMTSISGLGDNSLYTPWMLIRVAGDGTAKTLTVYFTSDSLNTRAINWNDDGVWIEIMSPDDAGTAQYDHISSEVHILATPLDVGTDGVSVWGAGTARNQKITQSVSPDYTGVLMARVHFNGGGNADTIYVDPKLEIA